MTRSCCVVVGSFQIRKTKPFYLPTTTQQLRVLQIVFSEAPEHLEARSCCVFVVNSQGKTALQETRSGGACTRASVYASCGAASKPTPAPPTVNPRATKEDKYTSTYDARSNQTPRRSKNEKGSSRVSTEPWQGLKAIMRTVRIAHGYDGRV